MAGPAYVLEQGFVVDDASNVTQYQCVVQGANPNEVKNPSGVLDSTSFYGVTQDAGTNTYTVNVRTHGITLVQAAGAITAGQQLVIANASGQVQAYAGFGNGSQVVGIALDAATNAGDLIPMLIQRSVQTQLKKLTNQAVGVASTAIAHGLGYTPTVVLISPLGAADVFEAAVADATNVHLQASVAINADVYVG